MALYAIDHRKQAGPAIRAAMIVFGSMALAADAQTNSAPDPRRLFDVPSPQMREQFVAAQSAPVQIVPTHLETPPVVALVATVDTESEHFKRIPHIEMQRREEVPESWAARSLDSVFRPEEFRVGKTTVSCSVATAIKRRNPLCLLNPIVFNLSW